MYTFIRYHIFLYLEKETHILDFVCRMEVTHKRCKDLARIQRYSVLREDTSPIHPYLVRRKIVYGNDSRRTIYISVA